MGSLLPSASQIVASSTAGATDYVTWFIPVIFFLLGLVVAVLLVKFVGKSVGRGVKSVTRRH